MLSDDKEMGNERERVNVHIVDGILLWKVKIIFILKERDKYLHKDNIRLTMGVVILLLVVNILCVEDSIHMKV